MLEKKSSLFNDILASLKTILKLLCFPLADENYSIQYILKELRKQVHLNMFSNSRFYFKVHIVFENKMRSLSWIFCPVERVCKQTGR